MKYEIFGYQVNSSFFILHSSLNFAKQNSFGRAASSRFALLASGYPLHHPRRRAPLVRMRSRVVSLLSLSLCAFRA
jgi:hypothetical protein